MRRLTDLLGSWRADRVEFLDESGAVRRVSAATMENRARLDGLLVAHVGRLEDPPIEVRGWYYWDPDRETLRLSTVTSSGRHDEFVGSWENGDLVLVTEPRASYEGRLFRLSQREIERDSFLETLEVSTDGGRSWRTSSRQRMRRVGSETANGRPAVLEALGEYVGHWRAEDRIDRDGNPFHFEYDLEWLDAERSIVEMAVLQVRPGRTTVVFEGYKGLEPSGDGVYYFGVSPSVRGARGEVILEGDDLVTVYEGWSPGGRMVEVRDVFSRVDADKDSFVSRTYLRSDSDVEWRQIGEDHWRRTADEPVLEE
ncbi:MAG: hypothetical protein R3244_08235 [Thermoanaerobaculia bacterium]|nr:hypothetical protein [Thermoanaerobaculia bacterium]